MCLNNYVHCSVIKAFIPFPPQVAETEVSVVEGGEMSYVHLSCPIPPGFFLSNFTLWSSAYITVASHLVFDNQPTCQDQALAQAMLAYDSDDNDAVACGVRFTSLNHQVVQRLTVRAVIDSPLQDGDQTGELQLNATFVQSVNKSFSVLLPPVQVRAEFSLCLFV